MRALWLAAAIVSLSCEPQPTFTKVTDPLVYVNPAMGTGGFAYNHGSAFPGACTPHGLVKAGPDTKGRYGDLHFLHYNGYYGGDDTVLGFSQLHLHGTGASDYGAIIIQPVTDTSIAPTDRTAYASPFDKTTEHLEAGAYAVTLKKWNVEVAITAAPHVAHYKLTYASGSARAVVFDLSRAVAPSEVKEQTLTTVDAHTLRGSLRLIGQMSGGYGGNVISFEVRTKQAFTLLNQDAATKSALLSFPAGDDAVELQIGVSLVSIAGATGNLNAETPSFDFDALKAQTQDLWRARSKQLLVYGGSEDDRRTFYSALRLSGVMPTTINDADGSYLFGGVAGTVAAGTRMLSDFSLWDTYRTTQPLYALIDQATARDATNSLLTMITRGRGAPLWPLATGETSTMLGAPTDIVVADAILRGVPELEPMRAWTALRPAALDDALSDTARGPRAASKHYAKTGFAAATESSRSVALTVEFANSDHALANLAKLVGATDDAAKLDQRSRGWRSLFDPQTKVLRAHQTDGSMVKEPYDPESWDHYAEANARQTSLMPWWDMAGFEQNFGGRDEVVNALNAFFDPAPEEEATALKNSAYELRYLPRQNFWASNEPDIQAPFMFALAGRHDLTAKWSVWVRNTFYAATPAGLPGNDDGGTMGSWYVFAALGLYPIAGTDRWVIGSPLFPRVDVAVPGGVFTIEANGVSADAIYVQSATLDGKPFNRVELAHRELHAGGKLTLKMGSKPSTWGR